MVPDNGRTAPELHRVEDDECKLAALSENFIGAPTDVGRLPRRMNLAKPTDPRLAWSRRLRWHILASRQASALLLSIMDKPSKPMIPRIINDAELGSGTGEGGASRNDMVVEENEREAEGPPAVVSTSMSPETRPVPEVR